MLLAGGGTFEGRGLMGGSRSPGKRLEGITEPRPFLFLSLLPGQEGEQLPLPRVSTVSHHKPRATGPGDPGRSPQAKIRLPSFQGRAPRVSLQWRPWARSQPDMQEVTTGLLCAVLKGNNCPRQSWRPRLYEEALLLLLVDGLTPGSVSSRRREGDTVLIITQKQN